MVKSKIVFILLFIFTGVAGFLYVTGRFEAMPQFVAPDKGWETPEAVTDKAPVRNAVSLPALMEKEFNGRDLKLVKVLAQNSAYTRYYITYLSGGLTISGVMNVPSGEGPFPVLVLNHGHIDTSVYTNGRGLKREQDYLARAGYVVLHPDYRNHADSGRDDRDELSVRLGYVEDVINAVYALKVSGFSFIDAGRVGMLGHSMGGGISLSVSVVRPELAKAIVLFAPVSGDMRASYLRWMTRRPETAARIAEVYGSPEESPEFWDDMSAESFYNRVAVPISIHHGTKDADVPIAWSEATEKKLVQEGKAVTLNIYDGEPHEFIAAWPQVMESVKEFFGTHVKGNSHE